MKQCGKTAAYCARQWRQVVLRSTQKNGGILITAISLGQLLPARMFRFTMKCLRRNKFDNSPGYANMYIHEHNISKFLVLFYPGR